MMATAKMNPPPIPKRFTKRRMVRHWGKEYRIRPAVAQGHLGDGGLLLWFQPLNTRPNFYLIRVDSKIAQGDDDYIYEVIDALIEEFSEKEREREYLADDLRAQGIEPTADNTDLAGNEGRLGWPVLSLDSGYAWGTEAQWDGRRWK